MTPEDQETNMYNRDAAMQMGRTAYMVNDKNELNTLLNDLTDVEPDIKEVEELLQGKKVNVLGEVTQTCEPLCNSEGAANMVRLMKAMVGRITLMSNFEDEQVRIMVEELGADIIEDLTFNKVRYEIKHPKAISTIVDLVLMKAFACGMSAMENGTRRMLRGTTMETTINTQGMGMGGKKSGGLGSILGLGTK